MTLDDCRAKLRRAKEHFQVIEGQIRSFLEPNPYRIVVERPAQRQYVVRIANEPPAIPAEDWALIIGDCVHNIRASLDYVAWQLAGARQSDTATMFPIFETQEGWLHKRAVERRALFPECVKAMLFEMQPFRTPDPRNAALNWIRLLDDSDKHKLLPVIVASQDRLSFHFKNLPIDDLGVPTLHVFSDCSLTYNAVLATISVEGGPPDVEMDAYFAPAIAFSDGAEVVPNLRNMLSEATNVANIFERRFVNKLMTIRRKW
jgi:hypothetical protein